MTTLAREHNLGYADAMKSAKGRVGHARKAGRRKKGPLTAVVSPHWLDRSLYSVRVVRVDNLRQAEAIARPRPPEPRQETKKPASPLHPRTCGFKAPEKKVAPPPVDNLPREVEIAGVRPKITNKIRKRAA